MREMWNIQSVTVGDCVGRIQSVMTSIFLPNSTFEYSVWDMKLQTPEVVKCSISASHFPSNFTKDNAFAMINQYDADHGTSKFSSGVDIPGRILSFFGRANYTFDGSLFVYCDIPCRWLF